jgi:uncharacterized NAD(P)/FAD-binding protein YdhS
VHHSDVLDGDRPVIAIIGGGASGTLAATCLLRQAAAASSPLRILLLDRHGRHGTGRAYSTTHPGHLLNSPAAAMSAVAGDLGHLTRWAAAAGIEHNGFLSRRDYGRYLRDVLAEAERAARPVADLDFISSEVLSIERADRQRPLRLHLSSGGRIDADTAILATGSLPPALPCAAPSGARYLADPWAPGALSAAGDGSPVIVLGTGLTMIDVAIAVTDAHPDTVVHAISRHALLPREHRHPPKSGLPCIQATALHAADVPALAQAPLAVAARESGGPIRLASLIRQFRAAVDEHPGDWRDIVDALRPQIPHLWQQLPAEDRSLFLRRFARYWEVHRHRMSPATASRIAELRATGRLSMLRGRLVSVSDEPDGVRARVDQDGAPTDLRAGWFINGTGAATDVASTSDPLLRSLLDSGLARPDPLRLGVDANAAGAVVDASGTPGNAIFTLGPTLRGTRYETTAIPEIRDQAAALASHLISTARADARPGSAA